MSGSRWVTTLLWLSKSLRPFFKKKKQHKNSPVYYCHILMSSASVRSIPFLSFIVPIFAWNVPLASLIFLKRSPVFPVLLFSYTSLHCSYSVWTYSVLVTLLRVTNQWNTFTPIGIAIITAADGKYTRVSTSLPTVNIWQVHRINPESWWISWPTHPKGSFYVFIFSE